MCDRVQLHGRCLALHLTRTCPPPQRPPRTPASPATSGTPTPTNAPHTPAHAHANTNANANQLNTYQDGFLLFQSWQGANRVCVWDRCVVEAVERVWFEGVVRGGQVVLLGGHNHHLDTLTHAWARALIVPPQGFIIQQLGEVSGCSMVAVPQGQFTPLGDALCWVIHRLRESEGLAGAEAVRTKLKVFFPSLVVPEPEVVHATLSTLIRQRKVYHTGTTYGIVQPHHHYYQPVGAPIEPSNTSTRVVEGPVSHVAVQTNLADLITGEPGPDDVIITPSQIVLVDGEGRSLEDQMALLGKGFTRGHPRAGSLRLSPTRAAHLTAMAHHSRHRHHQEIQYYVDNDMTDISVKGERGSVLTKLLRVSPRNRLASFSAQFPPPAWSRPTHPSTIHVHCVATQTSSRHPQVEQWWETTPGWSPRSSTLPRRLHRPRSSTPPTLRDVFKPPLRDTSAPLLDPGRGSPSPSPTFRSPHSSPHRRRSHASPHASPTRRPHAHMHENATRQHGRESSPRRLPAPEGSPHRPHKHRSPARAVSDGLAKHASDNRLSYKDLEASPSRMRQDGGMRRDGQDGQARGKAVQDGQARWKAVQDTTRPQREGQGRLSVKGKKEQLEVGADGAKQDKRKHNMVSPGKKVSDSPQHRKNRENIQAQNEENQLRQMKLRDKSDGSNKGAEPVRSPKHRVKEAVEGEKCEDGSPKECVRYNRSALQLDLTTTHMNNSRKVLPSPHKPRGIKTNDLHNKSMSDLSKESSHDVDSRNLCSTEVNKCDKVLCSQTLDQLTQAGTKSPQASPSEAHKLGVATIHSICDRAAVKAVQESSKSSSGSPDAASVKTYPSLSELNFNFRSITAQRILCGASVNSLDTLVEVNMAAEKKRDDQPNPVTNTDLGFV